MNFCNFWGTVRSPLLYCTSRRYLIRDISVTDAQVHLKGDFTSSAVLYKGYEAKYVNEVLYIKVKGGIFSFGKIKGIEISMINKYGKTKEIYLQGDKMGENDLIWVKN